MRRLPGVLAAASMFLLSVPALAGEPPVITVRAQLKVDRSRGAEKSFLYVTGDTLYPDATRLAVGLQAPGRRDWLKTTWCTVEKGHFLAEIGPWEQRFPPGRYHVVVEFRYEDQSPAQQQALGNFRDLERCIATDDKFAADYEAENPARAKMFRDYIAATKRCPGKTGTGDTWVQIGTETDAERAVATEIEFLRGTAENAARLAREVSSLGADGSSVNLPAWREELAQLDTDLHRTRSANVCSARPEAGQLLDAALMNLEWLAADCESLATGEGASLKREIARLEAKGEAADRDDRRMLARSRAALAALQDARAQHARSCAEALASALYGPAGLEPAPARAKAWAREFLEAFGLEPTTR